MKNVRVFPLAVVAAALFALAGCAHDGASNTGAAATAAQVKVAWPKLIVHLHAGNGKAYLVDPATDSVVATLDTVNSAGLGATTPDGRKVYAGAEGEGQNTVTVIDLDRRNVVARIATGNRPKHPAVSPDGKWAMINHWGLNNGKLRVTFIDTATDKIAKNVDLDLAGQAKGPTSIHNAWSYDSRYAFTVDRVDDNLVTIDTSDWSVKKIKMPSKPHYLTPSPDGRELWVTVEGKDKVSIVDAKTFKLVKDITIGKGRMGHVAFTRDSRYGYLSNAGDGNLHKLDMITLEVVKEIKTGNAPGAAQVLNVWTNVFEELPR